MRVLAYRPSVIGFVLLSWAGTLSVVQAQSTSPSSSPATAAQADSNVEPVPAAARNSAADGGPSEGHAAEAAAEAPPVVAPAAEAEVTTLAPGHVHIVVFTAENQPAVGAILRLPDGSEVVTDDSGAADLSLPAGNHRIELRWPPDAEGRGMDDVAVVSGLTTELIASVAADGSLNLDLMPPEQGAAEAVEQAAAAENLPTGIVTGVVKGEEEGEPVVGAGVFVAGQQAETVTDSEGRFQLELPIGTHTLSLIHAKYSTQTLPNVEVKEAEATTLEVALTPAAIELQEFVVTAPHISGGVASVLDSRRKSAAVSDAIGAADIARMPASNAAQAAQRVVGATIVGGRFVYVRGLGERYSNALLNGAPLPSPEPDRAAVPLDLFPSQILQSLDISKTFTPDVPGDFAGGSVRIVTKSVPEDFLFGVSLSLGFNNQSTFQKSYGQAKLGGLDFLGIDDGTRGLSDRVPSGYLLAQGAKKDPDGSVLDRDNLVGRQEVQELSPELNTPMYLRRRTMWPKGSGSVAIGNGWDLGGGVKLGALASLTYSRDFSFRDELRRDFRRDPMNDDADFLERWNDYRFQSAADEVRWGAFSSLVLQLGKEHKLSFVGMHSQLGDANTRRFSGFSAQNQLMNRAARQEFISRGLTNGQLQGQHKLKLLNNAEVRWLASLAQAVRNEDDTRDLLFGLQRNGWTLSADPSSTRHFFSDQSEFAQAYGLDYTQPIIEEDDLELKAKVGTLLSFKDRDFNSRNFRFLSQGDTSALNCGAQFEYLVCPRETFSDEIVGSTLLVGETTQPTSDSYVAQLNVQAAYIMGEVAFGDGWRVIGGVRAERTEQSIDGFDQFQQQVVDDENKRARLEQTDWLPAAAVVYSPFEEAAARLAVSQTLARPQLRELAPFSYVNYFAGARESGNPKLELTRILNADLRFEYFPSPAEVIALSFFAKDFTNPIEPVFQPVPDGANLTYQNANGASLYGVELEVRKNLGFLVEELEDFGVITSLMLAKSEISAQQTGNNFLTNPNRPLVQAAPYVINAALDYENDVGTQFRVLYNVSGRRIVFVGVDGLPDGYQQPQHMVDLTASQALGENFKLRLNVQNLLNSAYVVTMGTQERSYANPEVADNVVTKYKDGVSVSLGIAYNH